MVKKTIGKKSAKEIAKKVKPKPKPKTRVTKTKPATTKKISAKATKTKTTSATKPKTKVTKPKPKPSPKAQVRNKTAKPGLNLASKAKPVQSDKITPALAGTAAAGAAVGTGLTISARKNKGESFDDAFRKARAKGEGTLFTHNGKKYTAVTKDDLKKKGYATDTAGLAAYNKAGGKKKIVPAPNKTELTRKQKRKQRRKERIGFETFKQRRQARRAARKMKSGGVVSAKRSTPRGVGAAKKGFGRALKG